MRRRTRQHTWGGDSLARMGSVVDIESALAGLKKRCWGSHGTSDELGTLNWISPATRVAAAGLILDGDAVSLSRPLHVDHQGERALFSAPPKRQLVLAATDLVSEESVPWNIESWSFTYHGYVISHLDDWSHCSWRGEAYNGRRAADLVELDGHFPQGSRQGVFARGVLFDAAPQDGWLEPGVAIRRLDLDRMERESRLDPPVGQGDVVFVRTGQTRAMREAVGGFSPSRGMPACHWDVAEWLCDRRVAAFGSDGANDCQPPVVKGFSNPFHVLCLVGMGMPLLDNLDLESLAASCRAKGRSSFAVSVCPLTLQGGTGSPVNAVALF